MVIGQAAEDGVGGPDGAARERQMGAQFAGGGGQEAGAPDIRHETDRGLGMATRDRSVTTRIPAWADTPTPPPITMPSISATYGMGIGRYGR